MVFKITQNLKDIKKNEFLDRIIPQNKFSELKLNDNELEIITDKIIIRISEEISKNKSSQDNSDNFLNLLEPRKKVIERKEYSIGVKTFGFGLLGLCVFYWIYFFFIVHDYVPLTHTTYLTLILISLTCINKFESPLLNSFISVSSAGFLMISFFLLNTTRDIYSALGGPILHGAMAGLQLFVVFHKKITVSKRYLLIGFIFYIIFLNTIDDYGRLLEITNMGSIYTELMTSVQIFYIFILTAIFTYFWKKRNKNLLP